MILLLKLKRKTTGLTKPSFSKTDKTRQQNYLKHTTQYSDVKSTFSLSKYSEVQR